MFLMFFISVVEAARLYSVREAAKASVLGFDDARSEYKWVKPINNRNGFSPVFVKSLNDQTTNLLNDQTTNLLNE